MKSKSKDKIMIPGLNQSGYKVTVTRDRPNVGGQFVNNANVVKPVNSPHEVKRYLTNPGGESQKLNNESIRSYLNKKYAWDKQ